jgi:hypothetical protein
MDGLIFIFATALIVLSIGVVFLFRAREIRQVADEKAGELDWVLDQLDRAATQIQSDDEDTVIAGLQVIAKFNAPAVRARLFGRIEELKKSEMQNIAREAGWARDAIVRQAVFVKTRAKIGSSQGESSSKGS